MHFTVKIFVSSIYYSLKKIPIISSFEKHYSWYFFAFRYLVEVKEVEVDVRDKWDSTPL